MKKAMLMMVLMLVPFAMQAQTKYHDVEANDAKGAVKSLTVSMMGQEQTISFTKEGKQEGLTNAVYDDNGYLKSADREERGMAIATTYQWENGKVKSQTANVMGQQMPMVNTFNDKGELVKTTMNMGGQEMAIEYSDYKYDDHGNWISRKVSVMGQTMDTPRTIVYYE